MKEGVGVHGLRGRRGCTSEERCVGSSGGIDIDITVGGGIDIEGSIDMKISDIKARVMGRGMGVDIKVRGIGGGGGGGVRGDIDVEKIVVRAMVGECVVRVITRGVKVEVTRRVKVKVTRRGGVHIKVSDTMGSSIQVRESMVCHEVRHPLARRFLFLGGRWQAFIWRAKKRRSNNKHRTRC